MASNSQAEATLIHLLLKREFSEILDVVSEEAWNALAQRNDVAVLLLAFPELAAASRFRQRYLQRPARELDVQAQVVLLCSQDDVAAAYELSRSGEISDYVLFWPVTHDPKRLPLAVHRACDAYEVLVGSAADAAGESIVAVPPLQIMPELAVLVVEDDPFQLAVAISVLISAGLRAAGVSGARAAMAKLETAEPAVILLDIDMPEMGGLELLRLLKADTRHRNTPVIMLTVMREREMVLQALRDGAADFIVKPFDRDTLLQKIRRVAGPR